MSTITIDIDDTLMSKIKKVSQEKGVSIGALVKDLIEKGFHKDTKLDLLHTNTHKANILLMDIYNMVYDGNKSMYGQGHDDPGHAFEIIDRLTDSISEDKK